MSTEHPRIDSHHHFWHYDPVEYDWITEEMQAIRRDFLPEHLEQAMQRAGVDGVVSVQARQSLAETEWLLGMAAGRGFVRGVVGWVPLAEADVAETLGPLAANPKLSAVRHVLQDEPDPEYMLREDFNRGIQTLRQFGLVYDILIYERHLPPAIRFVDRHPNQIFVLDHIAKPRIKVHEISPWRENIVELAKRPNVYCKISGMVTEADYRTWTSEDLEPYFETVLEAFGPRRLMFGTDWPVCLVAVSYERWFEIVASRIRGLSPDERDRIMGGTAVEAYARR